MTAEELQRCLHRIANSGVVSKDNPLYDFYLNTPHTVQYLLALPPDEVLGMYAQFQLERGL